MKIDRELIQKILDYRHKIVFTRGRLAAGALLLAVVAFSIWLVFVKLGKFGYREADTTPINFYGDCSVLTQEECRMSPECVPLGVPGKESFALGEREVFVFETCVERVSDYANCSEVVKETQMKVSKFSKDCRCCCGEGPYCYPVKEYPEK